MHDLTSISFQCSFGLKSKVIQQKIKRQLDSHAIATPEFHHRKLHNITEKLVNLINIKGKIFYTTSGAESVSNAIKIVRAFSKKDLIFSIKKSYHGSINEALEVTGDWRRKHNHVPKKSHRWLPDPFEDPDFSRSHAILKEHTDRLSSIIIETTSGKNGVYTPPKAGGRD